MKKLAVAFAASAVAVSMLAFAGCGEPQPDKGAIKGNYEEKTPEQTTEILGNVNTDKIFNDETDAVNIGINVDLNGAFNYGEMLNANGALKLDYKMSASADSLAGTGTMALNASFMSMFSGEKQEQKIDFSGTASNDAQWIYAASDDNKIKINLEDIANIIGNNDGIIISPASFYEAEDAINVSQILAMAQQFGVKIAIDNSEGVKIKMSVTEETVWKVIETVGAEEGLTGEMITRIKGFVTFNSFKFDVYFAIDSEGAFSGASVVMDIDVKVDGNILSMFAPGSPSPTAQGVKVPDITAKVNGYVEIYAHNETVNIDSVTGDTSYIDMTDTVIGMIKGL